MPPKNYYLNKSDIIRLNSSAWATDGNASSATNAEKKARKREASEDEPGAGPDRTERSFMGKGSFEAN